jgi:hypothetical protein
MKKVDFFLSFLVGWGNRYSNLGGSFKRVIYNKRILYEIIIFFMMAGDKNSKDSGTDINKNEPLKFFFSMIIQTFQLFVYKNNTFVCLGKNSPFVFKTTTRFLYMCSQLLF